MRHWINIIAETTSYSARETEYEDNLLLLAYLKKNGISLDGLEDDDIERMRVEARANRYLYPIPTSEPDYLYHGTAKARLSKIKIDGLKPSEESHWTRSDLSRNSLGRVFFASTISKADFYARKASRSTAILRVRREALKDVQLDTQDGDGCYFVERGIPPEYIEMWSGKGWKGLKK